MHTFTMMVGSTDGITFRTEGKGRTTTITLADGKLFPRIATRVNQRHTSGPHDVPLPDDRVAVETGLLLWFLSPARPFSFEGGWNGVATQNMVLATPDYIYVYYCLRLNGSDSGPTRRMGCYHWGSRSPEIACVRAPASRPGGELPDSGSTIGDEKQRPVPRLSYHASGTPPQRRRE